MNKTIRIGSGAGYSGDRIEPAVDLIQKGDLDYIIFECLAERTIALAQLQKMQNKELGYDPLLEDRMKACLPYCVSNNVKLISNMGAANPVAAAKKTAKIANELGLKSIKIAAVFGDDVQSLLDFETQTLLETGEPLSVLDDKIISANTYLGVEGILSALKDGADIILTGRVADPALFLAPIIHEFDWSLSDYPLLGKGTALGHLMECAGQVCGGYFADGVKKQVPDLANLGFPIAEINEEGSFFITKLKDSGGMVTPATCKEQLLYEVHDPSEYLTPDVIADFSSISFKEIEKDTVEVSGATGKPLTGKLKVSVGYHDGYMADAQISYGGSYALERAKLAIDIIKERIQSIDLEVEDILFDLIGIDSLFKGNETKASPTEVRLRLAAKTKGRKEAVQLVNEVETLYTNGPAAGGGVGKTVTEIVAIQSVLIDKNRATPIVEYFES
ncbi:acyclic terpene utilization AtuA family protein [Flagellimonas halotolerans]|uniref:Acyclic terpene utilization AtuA family protein n=1 Tax=Flagellimonas halotolerans TaxID=3112164 RepID=A0ABU6ISP0_9FLAO|nr:MULTISPECIES: acyclic terpene utilization AtuA family protein [unclassified Allomuricauda]MEC3966103.1 acyclic terpene utilization AtuA family protein [Muricauda sp. SYSU M86414]MEC4265968.1 acyclic terpene utilization AtuA family protein [Muricauda sp. SYSU M84420]